MEVKKKKKARPNEAVIRIRALRLKKKDIIRIRSICCQKTRKGAPKCPNDLECNILLDPGPLKRAIIRLRNKLYNQIGKTINSSLNVSLNSD